MTKNTIVGIGVAAAILILVIVWLLVGRQAQYTQVSPSPTPTAFITPQVTIPGVEIPVATETATPAARATEVAITSAGFTPSTVEIQAGGTVTWRNTDSQAHQVASAPHPVHTDYPPLNSVGTLQPGQSRTLTFPNTGTYRYHDHLNPASRGTVVVR